MSLPFALQEALSQVIPSVSLSPLRKATSHMRQAYQQRKGLTDVVSYVAYLTCRLPATYAVLHFLLQEVKQVLTPTSLLDLGAGPGTAWWAAHTVWETPLPFTCVEKDPIWLEWGPRLGATAHWIRGDLEHLPPLAPHGLSILSYCLNELPPERVPSVLKHVWAASTEGILLIEPGTPAGSALILQARSLLLEWGGYIYAPCPHGDTCPLPSPRWCHFSTRLPRSRAHRTAKEAHCAFEDEKFSYLFVTRTPLSRGRARVLHTPHKHKGHVSLELCTREGLRQEVYTQKDKELYRKARKAEWGESWPPPSI